MTKHAVKLCRGTTQICTCAHTYTHRYTKKGRERAKDRKRKKRTNRERKKEVITIVYFAFTMRLKWIYNKNSWLHVRYMFNHSTVQSALTACPLSWTSTTVGSRQLTVTYNGNSRHIIHYLVHMYPFFLLTVVCWTHL